MLKARSTLSKMYHMGAGAMERATGVDRRDWLESRTGKRSSKDVTDAQLSNAIDILKREGWIKPVADLAKGGRRKHPVPDIEHNAQWERVAAAARDLGYNGLLDLRTQAFIKRTAKTSTPNKLTTRQLSAVIAGLERMHTQRQAKEASA